MSNSNEGNVVVLYQATNGITKLKLALPTPERPGWKLSEPINVLKDLFESCSPAKVVDPYSFYIPCDDYSKKLQQAGKKLTAGMVKEFCDKLGDNLALRIATKWQLNSLTGNKFLAAKLVITRASDPIPEQFVRTERKPSTIQFGNGGR